MYSILKHSTNEPIYKAETHTDIEKRLVVVSGERSAGGKDWECGINRCKLVCIGWINNDVVLYGQRTVVNILG